MVTQLSPRLRYYPAVRRLPERRLPLRLRLSSHFGQRGITPAFGYGAPHPSAEGTSTLPIWALPSAHYAAVRRLASSTTASPLRLPVAAQPRHGGWGEMRSPRFRRVPFIRNG